MTHNKVRIIVIVKIVTGDYDICVLCTFILCCVRLTNLPTGYFTLLCPWEHAMYGPHSDVELRGGLVIIGMAFQECWQN